MQITQGNWCKKAIFAGAAAAFTYSTLYVTESWSAFKAYLDSPSITLDYLALVDDYGAVSSRRCSYSKIILDFGLLAVGSEQLDVSHVTVWEYGKVQTPQFQVRQIRDGNFVASHDGAVGSIDGNVDLVTYGKLDDFSGTTVYFPRKVYGQAEKAAQDLFELGIREASYDLFGGKIDGKPKRKTMDEISKELESRCGWSLSKPRKHNIYIQHMQP
jgi:hypothetical protein